MGTGPSPTSTNPSSPDLGPSEVNWAILVPPCQIINLQPFTSAWGWETVLPQSCSFSFSLRRNLTMTTGALYLPREILPPPAFTSRGTM